MSGRRGMNRAVSARPAKGCSLMQFQAIEESFHYHRSRLPHRGGVVQVEQDLRIGNMEGKR